MFMSGIHQSTFEIRRLGVFPGLSVRSCPQFGSPPSLETDSYSSMSPDVSFYSGVCKGNYRQAKAALDAGANVNGWPPGQSYAPIIAATLANCAGMVNFLLKQGADPDKPVTAAEAAPTLGIVAASPGERALHIATITRNVQIVRLLLEAGANPALADEKGDIPLHEAAVSGCIDVVDMLHSRAPATLNFTGNKGESPLFAACYKGDESMVSKFLSLGATQLPPDGNFLYPLAKAVEKGFLGVVRLLMNDLGTRPAADDKALVVALCTAACFRQVKSLRLLLTVNGDERRSEWANAYQNGRSLLHFGARCCYPAAVSTLLEAGADETARDANGWIPRDIIGVKVDRDVKRQVDQREEVAIHRMLQRGPAYRARSWAWPSTEAEDAGCSGDGSTATTASAGAAAAVFVVLSPPPAMKTPRFLGGRISKPKEESSRKFFVRLVGRWVSPWIVARL